jgi:hypothetical protein
VGLRNNDFNKIHILLKQLARKDLAAAQRKAAAAFVRGLIDKNRASWSRTERELTEELKLVSASIAGEPKKIDKKDDRELRAREQSLDRQEELGGYSDYLQHLHRLLTYEPDFDKPLKDKVDSYLPEMAQGDNNSVGQIQHYVVGLTPAGITLDDAGRLDEERTFRHVNYPQLLLRQRANNVPQKSFSNQPIDFVAMILPDRRSYWLYSDESRQLMIETDADGRIRLRPVKKLSQADAGTPVQMEDIAWQSGLPLALFEDAKLHIPAGAERGAWLSQWHSEREWMQAIHECRYSTGVIGIVEELAPIGPNVPGKPGLDPVMLRYERRRRDLVEADFHVFAADHWNFNVRFPNAGGNHGAFFRISTHSVWMVAGPGIPVRSVEEPYDGLNFASTMLSLAGKPVPMPERVVSLH